MIACSSTAQQLNSSTAQSALNSATCARFPNNLPKAASHGGLFCFLCSLADAAPRREAALQCLHGDDARLGLAVEFRDATAASQGLPPPRCGFDLLRREERLQRREAIFPRRELSLLRREARLLPQELATSCHGRRTSCREGCASRLGRRRPQSLEARLLPSEARLPALECPPPVAGGAPPAAQKPPPAAKNRLPTREFHLLSRKTRLGAQKQPRKP